jgi:hypothetical protein
MLKFCALVLLLSTAAAYSQAPETKKHDAGPTLPLVKEVHNKEESRIHMGLNMGINNPEGTRGATPELGIDVGYQPMIPFGLSLELSTSRFDANDDELHKRVTLLTRGTYNFGGDTPVIRYSFIGLATGAVFLHDGTELGVAPLMGFDVPLDDAHNYSLGFIAKYLFVTSKDPDSLITSAALKIWF